MSNCNCFNNIAIMKTKWKI